MVVEEFHVNFTEDEKELLSSPEKWFSKVLGFSNCSFVDALESWSRRHAKGKAGRTGRSKTSKATSKRGFRLQKLVTSLLRSDKRQPPLCIFCLDDGSDTNEACGRLRWCPEIPLFFAVHELCALMTPEVLTVDNPTPLGKELFDTDMNQLHAAFTRGRKLNCSVCHERGAGIGCCYAACQRVFHLPCAIRSMCYLDYEEFRCFCSKHSQGAFEKATSSLFSRSLKKNSEEDLCCLCMDKVEPKIAMHSVIKMDCCGLRFYHFDCMLNATLVRGQEMRCPACNRPNEETCFEEKIKRQGIYVQTYNPPTEPDDDRLDGNVRSRCYYAMMRCSAKNRSCLSSMGPESYDDSDALNDSVYNPLEALNACITCGVHCHRICAGPPWSTYTPEDEGDEEKWQCEDCREISPPSTHSSVSANEARSIPSTPAEEVPVRVNSARNNRREYAANRGSSENMDSKPAEEQNKQISNSERSGKKRARGSINENSTANGPLKKQPLLRRWLTPINDHDLH